MPTPGQLVGITLSGIGRNDPSNASILLKRVVAEYDLRRFQSCYALHLLDLFWIGWIRSIDDMQQKICI